MKSTTKSRTVTEPSGGETIIFGDTAYEYVGKTRENKVKVRTLPFGGKLGFEQDLSRERLTICRFGILTGMDKGQGIVYINDYLRVPVTYLDERATLAFGNGKKKVVVSYLWDKDGKVREVSVPKKNVLDTLQIRDIM